MSRTHGSDRGIEVARVGCAEPIETVCLQPELLARIAVFGSILLRFDGFPKTLAPRAASAACRCGQSNYRISSKCSNLVCRLLLEQKKKCVTRARISEIQ